VDIGQRRQPATLALSGPSGSTPDPAVHMTEQASVSADDLIGMTDRFRTLTDDIRRLNKLRATNVQSFDQLVLEASRSPAGDARQKIDANLDKIVARVMALDDSLEELLHELTTEIEHFAGVSII